MTSNNETAALSSSRETSLHRGTVLVWKGGQHQVNILWMPQQYDGWIKGAGQKNLCFKRFNLKRANTKQKCTVCLTMPISRWLFPLSLKDATAIYLLLNSSLVVNQLSPGQSNTCLPSTTNWIGTLAQRHLNKQDDLHDLNDLHGHRMVQPCQSISYFMIVFKVHANSFLCVIEALWKGKTIVEVENFPDKIFSDFHCRSLTKFSPQF